MRIQPTVSVISPDRIEREIELHLKVKSAPFVPDLLEIPKAYAYAPLINSHDHLMGNWFPRSGDNRPYPNSHIWVEDMKKSFSYQERNQYWINDGSFNLMEPHANVLAQLGCYKNIFSGCSTVQDHTPIQPDIYYDSFPITVVKHFRQCHSITLDNWWGGGSCEEELCLSNGNMPFIIHLSEGTDEITRKEYSILKQRHLLQPNLLIIHGIALTKTELKEIAKAGASICWCPTSNLYLIGKTLDIKSCLELGVNVVLGTDSTQTGGINILDEITNAHLKFPEIPMQTLYRMVTVNAAKALYLPPETAILNPAHTSNLLLMDALEHDPLENLLEVNSEHIQLLLHKGIPIYGDAEWLEYFQSLQADYTEFRVGKREKFVIGDPLELNDQIDAALGYHKDFPYLPF
jgi:5-methylthioadenosine/S-adenosylhomocysteine deaminase